MKLRVITSACLLVALVAAGLWGVQRLSAQDVETPPATTAAASAPAAAPVSTRALGVEAGVKDVLGSAPKPTSTPAATITPRPTILLPGAVVPLAPPTVDIYAPVGGGRSGVNDIYGVQGGKVLHFESHSITLPDAIRQTAKELRDATDGAAKTAAQRQLNELLDKYFELDMKRREAELKQVELRTKDLHALLERRRAKKSEIVELQTKVLLNEADGLGFFNESPMPAPDRYNATPDDSKLYYPAVVPIPGTGRRASELSPPTPQAVMQPTYTQPAPVPGRPASDLFPATPPAGTQPAEVLPGEPEGNY